MLALGSTFRRQSVSFLVRDDDLHGAASRLAALSPHDAAAEVNEQRTGLDPPLILAAVHNNSAMVELLLQHGADTEGANRYGYTALQEAILHGAVRAALTLTRHGATGDRVVIAKPQEFVSNGLVRSTMSSKRGFSLGSPLHDAVHRNMVSVVRALLENDADPDVLCQSVHNDTFLVMQPKLSEVDAIVDACTEWDAARREWERKRLGAKLLATAANESDRDPETRVRNALALSDAEAMFHALRDCGSTDIAEVVSRFLRDHNDRTVRRLVVEFSDIEVAAAAKNTRAVDAIVRRLVKRGDFEAALSHVLDAADRSLPVEVQRCGVWTWTIEHGTLDEFTRLLAADAEHNTRGPAVVAADLRGPDGATALHVAAQSAREDVVRFLLTECVMNPSATDDLGRTPVEMITDCVNGDPRARVRTLLERATKHQAFLDGCTQLVSRGNTATARVEDVVSLTALVTTAYDLHPLYYLSQTLDTVAERRHVMVAAFTHVLADKLVLAESAALFFFDVLRWCKRDGILHKAEYDLWKLRARQCNMEGAAWVGELKQSIAQLDACVSMVEGNASHLRERFDQLCAALDAQDAADSHAAKLKCLICLLAIPLTPACGALVTSYVGAGAAVATASALVDPAGIVGGHLSDKDYLRGMSDQLAGLAVKDAAMMYLESAGVTPAECASAVQSATLAVGLAAAVDAHSAATRWVGDDRGYVLRHLMMYPYHHAVVRSDGDVVRFHQETADTTPMAGAATAKVLVWYRDWQRQQTQAELSAVELAAVLGYAGVVDALLALPEVAATCVPALMRQLAATVPTAAPRCQSRRL